MMAKKKPGTTSTSPDSKVDSVAAAPGQPFPVVGIGASAGGFAAIHELLTELPVDLGMSFVLVQHLSPVYQSNLAELLSSATRMPVHTIEDNMTMHPDTIYVIPPGMLVSLQEHTLNLRPRGAASGPFLSIDHFLISLAANCKESAVGIVLSGTGSDGTLGLKAIKEGGGITLAQKEQTAEFSEMPHNAITAGYVDLILSPVEISAELTRLARHPLLRTVCDTSADAQLDEKVVEEVLLQLKTLGVDFVGYKRSTVCRRILRRMAIHKLTDLNGYAEFLRAHPEEAAALSEDMLIKVTSFFRDPAAFDALKWTVFPKIIEGKGDDTPVRIWVAGCATGQEAYSIVISLLEFLASTGAVVPIQLFGTDISEPAIKKARRGIYSKAEVADLNPSQLKTYFSEIHDGYQVKKTVRELCVFARQDFTHDPPFSRLDLISCRNVLIYFGASLQKKVLPLFHYSLQPGGFLLLGASESIGTFDDLFFTVNKRNRIFAKQGGALVAPREFRMSTAAGGFKPLSYAPAKEPPTELQDIQTLTDKILLLKYKPSAVVVDRDMNLLHFRGDTGPYLQPMQGEASLNLLKMVHNDLRMELRTLLHRAQKEQTSQRRGDLCVKLDDITRSLALEVTPFSGRNDTPLYLVQFDPEPTPVEPNPNGVTGEHGGESISEEELRRLRQDLSSTQDYMQTLIGEREKALEETKTVNEEMLSSNEELQSINEELETAKEELESSNEELSTVNAELQTRNLELSQAHGDLRNLLLSAQIPFVIVEEDLRVRLVGPNAANSLNVVQSDVGRPITALHVPLPIPDPEKTLRAVIRNGESFELECRDQRGVWNLLRISPYKAVENKIEGAVITLYDIDRLKKSMDETEIAHKHAMRIVDTIKDPLMVLDRDLRVKTANPAFYEKFQVAQHEIEGKRIFDLGAGQWENPELRRLLEGILPKSAQMDNFLVQFDFPHLGPCSMLLSARRMHAREPEQDSILLGIQDVTERLNLEESLRQAKREAEKASQAKSEFLANMSHEIRTPMTTVIGALDHLRNANLESEYLRCLELADTAAESLMELLGDILDFSRIDADKLTLEQTPFDLRHFVTDAVDILGMRGEKKGLGMNLDFAADAPATIIGDQARLRQVLVNLVGNATKFTDKGEISISVGLVEAPDLPMLQFTVRDTGIGIPPENMAGLFKSFCKSTSAKNQEYAGTGLGLAICKAIVERMGGEITVESRVDEGSTFRFTIPLRSEVADVHTHRECANPTRDFLVDGHTPRILLGEDDSAIRKLMVLQMSSRGWEIVPFGDGQSVVEAWQQGGFDLILMDAQMPVVDGYEATRMIREQEKSTGRHIPILALTAHAGSENKSKALAAGMDGYLTKPIHMDELYTMMARYLNPDQKSTGESE
jgi:two-component system CheB/CheR fusion protein